MSDRRVPAALRRQVRERARGCCEYCLLSEEDAWFSHEPDHVIAAKHGGETIFENLAWACFDCNRSKGSDIASRDPVTKVVIPLCDPRIDRWNEHFEIERGSILPVTAVGRVTERILRLNLPDRIEVRKTLARINRYPG